MRRALAGALVLLGVLAGCSSTPPAPPQSAVAWLHSHDYLTRSRPDRGALNVWDVATSLLGRERGLRLRHDVTGDPIAFRDALLQRTCDYVFGDAAAIRRALHVRHYSLRLLTSGPIPAPYGSSTGYALLCSYSVDARGSRLLDLEIAPGALDLHNLTTYATVHRGSVTGAVAFTAAPRGIVGVRKAQAYLRARLVRATYAGPHVR